MDEKYEPIHVGGSPAQQYEYHDSFCSNQRPPNDCRPVRLRESHMNTRRQFLITASMGAVASVSACRGDDSKGVVKAPPPRTGASPTAGGSPTAGAPPTFGTGPVSGPPVSETTFAEA